MENKSVLIGFHPHKVIYWTHSGLPNSKLKIGNDVSLDPDCAAPFHSSGDILISKNNEFVGFSYTVHEKHAYAELLAKSANSTSVRYIKNHEEHFQYIKNVYGNVGYDYFEIIIFNYEPVKVITALSHDGFWYLNSNNNKLLAFGISDLDDLLKDHDIILGKIQTQHSFVPRWV